MNNPTCPICGRELRGVTLDFGSEWTCSDCDTDMESVLHCETGCKVRAAHIDRGYKGDIEWAEKYLKLGAEYTVESITVGRSYSTITLKEIRGIKFNSVQFVRSSAEKPKPKAGRPRRKYRRGGHITSIDELMKQDLVYFFDRIYSKGWFQNWNLHWAERYIGENGMLYYAVKEGEDGTAESR